MNAEYQAFSTKEGVWFLKMSVSGIWGFNMSMCCYLIYVENNSLFHGRLAECSKDSSRHGGCTLFSNLHPLNSFPYTSYSIYMDSKPVWVKHIVTHVS